MHPAHWVGRFFFDGRLGHSTCRGDGVVFVPMLVVQLSSLQLDLTGNHTRRVLTDLHSSDSILHQQLRQKPDRQLTIG